MTNFSLPAKTVETDTTVARIVHLVEEAQESRAPIQQWVALFSAIYTPIVLILAVGKIDVALEAADVVWSEMISDV